MEGQQGRPLDPVNGSALVGAVGGLTLGKQNQGVPLREGASGGKLCSGDGHFLDKGEGGSLVILVHIFVVEAEPVGGLGGVLGLGPLRAGGEGVQRQGQVPVQGHPVDAAVDASAHQGVVGTVGDKGKGGVFRLAGFPGLEGKPPNDPHRQQHQQDRPNQHCQPFFSPFGHPFHLLSCCS